MGSIAYAILVDPFVQMVELPDFFLQVLWEGFVSGVLYGLIALGFVLIFKASGVFNFAQGIMVVFAALSLVGLHQLGLPAYVALGACILIMLALAFGVERLVLLDHSENGLFHIERELRGLASGTEVVSQNVPRVTGPTASMVGKEPSSHPTRCPQVVVSRPSRCGSGRASPSARSCRIRGSASRA